MKKIYSADNLVVVMHMKNVLETHGIGSDVRNQFLSGALGDLPPQDCWPQLWVLNDADVERAEAIVKEHTQAPDDAGSDWTCRRCGEQVEAQFGECWQCGGPAPALGT